MTKNELYEINSGIQARLPQKSPRFSRSFTDLFSSDWLIASRRWICCNAPISCYVKRRTSFGRDQFSLPRPSKSRSFRFWRGAKPKGPDDWSFGDQVYDLIDRMSEEGAGAVEQRTPLLKQWLLKQWLQSNWKRKAAKKKGQGSFSSASPVTTHIALGEVVGKVR